MWAAKRSKPQSSSVPVITDQLAKISVYEFPFMQSRQLSHHVVILRHCTEGLFKSAQFVLCVSQTVKGASDLQVILAPLVERFEGCFKHSAMPIISQGAPYGCMTHHASPNWFICRYTSPIL
jgi:hypothetical protein